MSLTRVDDLAEITTFLSKVQLEKEKVYRNTFSFFCSEENELRHAEVSLEASILSSQVWQMSHGMGWNVETYHYVLGITCSNCRNKSIVFFYHTPDEERIVLIRPDKSSSFEATVNKEVIYYLSQAHRSHSVGANSAAIAMYRAALEQLLFHQGYIDGMLNAKIKKLTSDIEDGSAPAWARNLDTEYLSIIKELGNTSIHPNDGDIEKQKVLDSDLVSAVEVTFSEILDKVFEAPAKEAARKSLLKSAIAKKS